VPTKLLDFDPDDWVLAGRSNPARIQMALDRWYQARWESVMEDPHKRTIDGKDVIDICSNVAKTRPHRPIFDQK
jgi:hypothetical protein